MLSNSAHPDFGSWVCGRCSARYHYREAAALDKAHEAAERCCLPIVCGRCHGPIDEERARIYRPANYGGKLEDMRCDGCVQQESTEARHQRTQAQFAAAQYVMDYDDVVYWPDGPEGDYGDGYFSSPEAVYDHVIENAEDFRSENDIYCGPLQVFCCKANQLRLDLGHAMENLCDNGWEDMSEHLITPPELTAAVALFNELNATTLRVYEVDYKRKFALSDIITVWRKALESEA